MIAPVLLNSLAILCLAAGSVAHTLTIRSLAKRIRRLEMEAAERKLHEILANMSGVNSHEQTKELSTVQALSQSENPST